MLPGAFCEGQLSKCRCYAMVHVVQATTPTPLSHSLFKPALSSSASSETAELLQHSKDGLRMYAVVPATREAAVVCHLKLSESQAMALVQSMPKSKS